MQKLIPLAPKRELLSLFLLLWILSSCTANPLTIQSKYLTVEDLASYNVGSPDPTKECPNIGQRLIVRWALDPCAMKAEEQMLHLHIRYGTQKEHLVTHTIEEQRGVLIYDLLNEEYFEQQGILSYYAEILADGALTEQWIHQIWTERIEFEE